MILMLDLFWGGSVSEAGAVGWGMGIKWSVANISSTDIAVIWGNLDTMFTTAGHRNSYEKINNVKLEI